MRTLPARWALPAAIVLAVGLGIAQRDKPEGQEAASQVKGPPPPAAPAARPDAKAEAPRPSTAPPPAAVGGDKGAKDLLPLPLNLPRAEIIGTPKNVLPGTRMKAPPKDFVPRKPFLAPKGVTNVALHKPVTSSDPEPVIGELKMVTDGNKDAAEYTYVELGPDTQYVQVDLGRPYAIHAVVLWHEHHEQVVYHDVVVQVADDKDFITNVRTLYNNDHDNSSGLGIGGDWAEYFETFEGLLVDAKGARARYVRLHSGGCTSGDWSRYTEVEVYGLGAK